MLRPTAGPMASGPGLARPKTLAATGLAKWRPSAAETNKPSVTALNGVTDGNSKQSVPSAGAVSDHLTPHTVVGLSHEPKTRAGA